MDKNRQIAKLASIVEQQSEQIRKDELKYIAAVRKYEARTAELTAELDQQRAKEADDFVIQKETLRLQEIIFEKD